jgi:glycosyltransferase involved in cell wall biosynthesis
MKILHIVFSFKSGGIENMLVDILNHQSINNEVHLLISDGEHDPELVAKINQHVNIIILNRKKNILILLWLIKLIFQLITIRPDVVHSHAWKFIKILKYFNFRKILTLHNRANEFWSYEMEFCCYDQIVSISEFVKDDFLKSGICSTKVINNGIDFKSFRKRKEYGFDSFQIIQVGRLFTLQKGQDILIRALYRIIHDFGFRNVHLTLVGDGPSEEQIKTLINSLGLNNYCSLPGRKDRNWLHENLCNYNLLVQPSRNEGFGLTVIEGIAAKIPVLVSNIEGPIEIIERGELGYYFETESDKNCAEALMQIINTPDFKIKSLTEKSYDKAKRKYDISKTVADYLEVYTQ